MGRVTINFSEVEGGFEPVPEGRYEVIIERVEVRESKSSEHNYLNWEMKITDDDYENQRLWMITSLSPRALFRLKDVLEQLKVLEDEMDLDWDDEVEITPSEGPLLLEPDVVGMSATAVVKNEMYEGKERNRVDDLIASGASSGAGAASRPAKANGSSGTAKKPTKAAPKKAAGRRALR